MEDILHIEVKWTEAHFNKVFEDTIKANKDITYQSAYIMVEDQHISLFGKVRYSSYDSFRVCRKKMLFGS